ncbi:FHA domain-containing protein, partial [Gemmatimonadota bacterium]
APGLTAAVANTVVEEEGDSRLFVPSPRPVREPLLEVPRESPLRRLAARLRGGIQSWIPRRDGARADGTSETQAKDIPQLVFGGAAASYVGSREEGSPHRQKEPPATGREGDIDPGADVDIGPVQRATLQMLPGRLEPLNKDVIQQEVRFLRAKGEAQEVTLGWDLRPPPGHVTLDHPSIQPLHAKMAFREGGWWIQSLSEYYPVEVNDVPLQLSEDPVRLENGDRIRFGEAVFRFWMS